jgi:hypothetical protein
MHNGHVVLANGSGSSPSAPSPEPNGVNGATSGGGVVHGIDEGVHQGRRMAKYEAVEKDNLIDLN